MWERYEKWEILTIFPKSSEQFWTSLGLKLKYRVRTAILTLIKNIYFKITKSFHVFKNTQKKMSKIYKINYETARTTKKYMDVNIE